MLLREPDAPAVLRALGRFDQHVSSRLLGVELRRRALRHDLLAGADQLLGAVALVPMDRSLLESDGNKRTGLAVMIRFLERNGLAWGEPDVASDAAAVRRVAAGEADLDEIVTWIRQRTRPL